MSTKQNWWMSGTSARERVIAGIAFVIFSLLLASTAANAIETATFVPLSVQINIGYDSSDLRIDSVVFRSKHRRKTNPSWSFLGKGSKCALYTDDNNTNTFIDSLCWDIEVSIDSFQTFSSDYGYMPSVAAWIYWNTRRGITREDIDITPIIYALNQVDTVLRGVTASFDSADATFLADTVDTRLSAAHSLTSADWSATGAGASGSGAYLCTLLVIDTSQAPDDTLANFNVQVLDYSRTPKAWPNTGADNLKAVVELNNENLTFLAQGNWYFQEAGSDSVAFPAKDTNLTILVYKFAALTPGTVDSTILVFNLPGVDWRVSIKPLLSGQGHLDSANRFILNETLYGKPNAVTFVAQVAVLRSTAADPAVKYELKVYHKDDKRELLNLDNYITPDAVSTVVTW
jgi:hypothetical protein